MHFHRILGDIPPVSDACPEREKNMRFSVIIPVYNKADTVLETVQSVLAQRYEDREIIVVDDGSQDNLEEALSSVRANIRIIHQENAGVAAARNRGICESTGAYICFLDADDIWLPEHLTALSNAIDAEPEACFFSTMFRTTFPDGTFKSKLSILPGHQEMFWVEDYFKMVLDYSTTFIHTDSVCIKRSLLETFRFEDGEKVGEDTDLWYRIAAYYPLLLVKKETAIYRRELSTATAGGTNNLDWAFARRESQLIHDEKITRTKRRHIQLLLDRWRCTCCRQLLAQGNLKEARQCLKQLRYPLQKRGLYCAVLCTLPRCLQNKILRK